MKGARHAKDLVALPFGPKGKPFRLLLEVQEGATLARAHFGEGVQLVVGTWRSEEAPTLLLSLDFREEEILIRFPENVHTHPEERLLVWKKGGGKSLEGSLGVFLPWESLVEASYLLSEAVAALSPLLRWRGGPGRVVREALSRAEELADLLSGVDEGGVGRHARQRFEAAATEEGVLLWSAELHPLAPLLRVLPEGKTYRGPLPGYPGAVLEGELVMPWSGTVLLAPRGLLIGSLSLPPKKGELPLFPGAPDLPERILEAFRVPREAWPLLGEGRGEEAAPVVVLHRLEDA